MRSTQSVSLYALFRTIPYTGVIDMFVLSTVMLVSYGLLAVFIDLIGPYLLVGRALPLVYGNTLLLFISYACVVLALCRPLLISPQLRYVKSLVLFVFVMSLAHLYVNPFESTRVFLNDLFSAKHGTTIERVQRRMSKYWQINSSGLAYRQRFESDYTGSISYIHGLDPNRNGDVGTVSFSQGRVVSVLFYPD